MPSSRKKLLKMVAATVLVSALVLLFPHFAAAFSPGAAIAKTVGRIISVDKIVGAAIGWVVYVVTYIVTYIFGLTIPVLTWFLNVFLQLNSQIVDSPLVGHGFQLTLSIANLGFVLGIIVVAIATILRKETYGIKQILWKLVVAAVLVNFSLAIGGAIIGFSNNLTEYFQKSFTDKNVTDALVGAFAPQKTFLSLNSENVTDVNGALQETGEGFGIYLSLVANLVFPLVMLVIFVITLAALAVMFLIRYVHLAISLIMMPFAWLMWIFPNFRHLWTKWWNGFLRWSFFAPIMTFFLWLAVETGNSMNNDGVFNVAKYSSPSQVDFIKGISSLYGSAANSMLSTLLQMVVMIALTVGGLFAANSLSITGAGVAMGAARAAGGWAGGKVWKGAKRGGSALVPTKIKEKLEAGGYRFVPKRMQVAAGEGLRRAERAGGSNLVEAEMAAARKLVKEDPKAAERMLSAGLGLAGGVSNERGLALMKAFAEQGKTAGLKIGGKNLEDFVKNNESLLQSYGQGKAFDKATGGDKETRDAERELEKAIAEGRGISEAAKKLDAAAEKFVSGLEKQDMYDMDVNSVFGKETTMSKALAKAFAKFAPHLVPNALGRMKPPTLKMFNQIYREQINKSVDETNKDATLTQAEKDDILKKLAFAEDAFSHAFANNAFGFTPKEQAGGGAVPSPAGGGAKTT